jgi:hypothetical protein
MATVTISAPEASVCPPGLFEITVFAGSNQQAGLKTPTGHRPAIVFTAAYGLERVSVWSPSFRAGGSVEAAGDDGLIVFDRNTGIGPGQDSAIRADKVQASPTVRDSPLTIMSMKNLGHG